MGEVGRLLGGGTQGTQSQEVCGWGNVEQAQVGREAASKGSKRQEEIMSSQPEALASWVGKAKCSQLSKRTKPRTLTLLFLQMLDGAVSKAGKKSMVPASFAL